MDSQDLQIAPAIGGQTKIESPPPPGMGKPNERSSGNGHLVDGKMVSNGLRDLKTIRCKANSCQAGGRQLEER